MEGTESPQTGPLDSRYPIEDDRVSPQNAPFSAFRRLKSTGQTLAQSNAINCLLFSSRMTSAEALNQALCPKGCRKILSPEGSQEASMASVTKAEPLETASMKLAEVVQLLMEAGEKRMTREAEELVQQVEASALTSQITISTSH